MKNAGIVLIVIGVIMMIVTGFNFVTREKVVDVGSVHISTNKNNPIQWSPVVGVVILAAGITLTLTNRNKK